MWAVYCGRFWRMGGSWGVILPKDVREKLGLRPGDLMLMRCFEDMVVLRRATPEMIVERAALPDEAIPPVRAQVVKNA